MKPDFIPINAFPSLEALRKGYRASALSALALPKGQISHFVRNPLDAYRFYARYGRCWYEFFRTSRCSHAIAFGTHWRQLMEDYLRDAKKPDAMLLRYEDLIGDGPQMGEIDAYLGIRMNHSILDANVSSSERGGEKVQVSRLEKWPLKGVVSPMTEEPAYKW